MESKPHNLQQHRFVVEGSLIFSSGRVQHLKLHVSYVAMIYSMQHHLSEFSDPGLGLAKGTAFKHRMVVARG